ncbi:MAG: peptidoglycan-binding protein [Thermoanaerobaculia bacterium]|nr:peptidoglycan-binding protein [Thermoanaerobaculia bacterium]
MALSSPRFQSSTTLQRVDSGAALLTTGSSGRAVHLVQFALLDLGFAMPRSTGNASSSPDGVYGEETKAVVKLFQKGVPGLSQDGVVGQKTLRALDQRIGGFTHRVRLHFRSIAMTNVPFNRSFSNAETVFAQYGIRIEFGSGESINLTPQQRSIFDKIDQECDWDLTDGEFHMLQGLGSRAPASDILVFHVSSFADANVLGCGGHAPNRPACTITAGALAWDTAHEVCHVLLGSAFNPVHIQDRRNLMHPTSRSEASIPTLTLAQVNRVRASPCCHAA